MIYLGQYIWYSGPPLINVQIWYEKSRSGTTQNYRFKIRMWLDSYSWYDNRIRGVHTLNGVQVNNDLIKTYTSGTWDVTVTTPWFNVANKVTGTTPYSLRIYDDNDGSGSVTYSFNLDIDSATPIITIYEVEHTHNSITLGYNSSGPTAPTQVQINNGNVVLGTYAGNPFVVTGLSSDTTYNDIKGYGYSSAGWGVVSNSLSIKTYPDPVTITSTNISDINPFGCILSMGVSNINNTQSTEYSIYNSAGDTLITGPFIDTPGQFSKTISDLNPETSYQAKFRVRTKESLVWSDYSIANFATITDQSQGWIKYGGNWVKGKVYIKNNSIWSEAKKTYIKVSGTWRETVNN